MTITSIRQEFILSMKILWSKAINKSRTKLLTKQIQSLEICFLLLNV